MRQVKQLANYRSRALGNSISAENNQNFVGGRESKRFYFCDQFRRPVRGQVVSYHRWKKKKTRGCYESVRGCCAVDVKEIGRGTEVGGQALIDERWWESELGSHHVVGRGQFRVGRAALFCASQIRRNTLVGRVISWDSRVETTQRNIIREWGWCEGGAVTTPVWQDAFMRSPNSCGCSEGSCFTKNIWKFWHGLSPGNAKLWVVFGMPRCLGVSMKSEI